MKANVLFVVTDNSEDGTAESGSAAGRPRHNADLVFPPSPKTAKYSKKINPYVLNKSLDMANLKNKVKLHQGELSYIGNNLHLPLLSPKLEVEHDIYQKYKCKLKH